MRFSGVMASDRLMSVTVSSACASEGRQPLHTCNSRSKVERQRRVGCSPVVHKRGCPHAAGWIEYRPDRREAGSPARTFEACDDRGRPLAVLAPTLPMPMPTPPSPTIDMALDPKVAEILSLATSSAACRPAS